MFHAPRLLVKQTGLRSAEGFDTVDQILASARGVTIQMDMPSIGGISVQANDHLDVRCWPHRPEGMETYDYLGTGRVIEKMSDDAKKTKLLLSCGGLVAHITTPTPHELDALQVNEKVWIGVNKV